ncbi:hypothetical protein YC2023_016043 [Brassica napus]
MHSIPARVPACSSSRPIVQLEVLLVVRFYNLQNLKGNSKSENMNRIWLFSVRLVFLFWPCGFLMAVWLLLGREA